jgi:hypothetical protein
MEAIKPQPEKKDGAAWGTPRPGAAAVGSPKGERNGLLVVLLSLLLLTCMALLLHVSASPAPTSRAAAPQPVEGILSQPVTNTFTVTLPLIIGPPAEPPGAGDPIVYDCDGDVSTTHWLTTTFGAVTWTQNVSIPLTAVHARCGDQPAVIIAHVQDGSGHPLENVTVVFSWPDAPTLPSELQNCGLDKGVFGPTNMNGDIGFGLGTGAYYYPPAGGPHTVWLPGGACLYGLGMIGGTNHWHVDGDWTLRDAAGVLSPGLRAWGFSPHCPASLEDVGGRAMWVLRCAH